MYIPAYPRIQTFKSDELVDRFVIPLEYADLPVEKVRIVGYEGGVHVPRIQYWQDGARLHLILLDGPDRVSGYIAFPPSVDEKYARQLRIEAIAYAAIFVVIFIPILYLAFRGF